MIALPLRWDEPPPAEVWTEGQHGIPDAPVLAVQENPEIGRLFGPNGELLSIVRARPVVSFGFS